MSPITLDQLRRLSWVFSTYREFTGVWGEEDDKIERWIEEAIRDGERAAASTASDPLGEPDN
jgi:hypothetical protein